MSKKVVQKCGTCRWLRPRTDGKPFHHAHAYACLWQPPEIVWPSSVQVGGYNDPRQTIRNAASYMTPGDGKDCPCWEPSAPK